MTRDEPLGPDILEPVRGGLESEDSDDLPTTAVMDNLSTSTEESP